MAETLTARLGPPTTTPMLERLSQLSRQQAEVPST